MSDRTFEDTRPSGHPRRIRDLGIAGWLMLADAFAMLAASSIAIRLLPFRRVVRMAGVSRAIAKPDVETRPIIDRAVWAVEAVAWRVPWRTVCFQKGLALHLILRRRDIASRLHYGVGKDEKGDLGAHVWISVDETIVMGGNVVERYRCLATYPAAD